LAELFQNDARYIRQHTEEVSVLCEKVCGTSIGSESVLARGSNENVASDHCDGEPEKVVLLAERTLVHGEYLAAGIEQVDTSTAIRGRRANENLVARESDYCVPETIRLLARIGIGLGQPELGLGGGLSSHQQTRERQGDGCCSTKVHEDTADQPANHGNSLAVKPNLARAAEWC
jgi:hypothetical protein